MEVLHNVELNKKTTFRVGGIAKNFYIPKNENELVELLKTKLNDIYIYIYCLGVLIY